MVFIISPKLVKKHQKSFTFTIALFVIPLEEISLVDSEEKKTPVRETSTPVPESEIEKEEAEASSIQQITMDAEAEEGLQVAEEIQAREEEVEEEAEEITEEEQVTQQLKGTDEPVPTVEEEEEEDEEEEEGEEEMQCLSQKNNSDHQYFSGDFGKIQTKETGETEKDSEDDDDEEEDEEDIQSQVEPSSLISPVHAASAQELDVITHSNINLNHPLGEDEEEEEDEEERDDASDKDSPTVVIELGSEGEEEEEEEEEDDGEEEEADEADDDELDSMSQRSEVTDDSETYDMTRGNLGLLEQAIALKAKQTGRSSEESCSPEQQCYHSSEESMSKTMDITARRAYYGKGDRKLLPTSYDPNSI